MGRRLLFTGSASVWITTLEACLRGRRGDFKQVIQAMLSCVHNRVESARAIHDGTDCDMLLEFRFLSKLLDS